MLTPEERAARRLGWVQVLTTCVFTAIIAMMSDNAYVILATGVLYGIAIGVCQNRLYRWVTEPERETSPL